jgi:CDGSH-type Zn-finger protein
MIGITSLESIRYNARGHKMRLPTLEKAQFVTVMGITTHTKEYRMPEITSAEKNGHIRHTVTIQADEKVVLCRCYKSEKFPLCDGSHARAEGVVGPVVVQVAQPAPDIKPD